MSENKKEIKLTRADKKTIAKSRETFTDIVSDQITEEKKEKENIDKF